MKNVVLCSMLLAGSLSAYSQEWKSDLNGAFKEASASGKNVLLFFSVSKACESCKRLDEKVLRSDDFKDFATSNYVLVKQDFESGAASNIEENLLIVEKYNKDGFFPLVVIIGKNEKVLGQIGAYNNETPKQYIEKLQSIKKG